MKTQQDSKVRIVALENLYAMCVRISGMCHTFTVTSVSRSRVHVSYSNPDEYGAPHTITAVFPCYPSSWPGDEENPRVVLDALRYIGVTERNPEDWQGFEALYDCPTVWRATADPGQWYSHAELATRGLDRMPAGPCRSCVECDRPIV